MIAVTNNLKYYSHNGIIRQSGISDDKVLLYTFKRGGQINTSSHFPFSCFVINAVRPLIIFTIGGVIHKNFSIKLFSVGLTFPHNPKATTKGLC